jgi:hypothetical protein
MRDVLGEVAGLFDTRQREVAAVDNERRRGDLVEQRTEVHRCEVPCQRCCGTRPSPEALEPGAELEIVREVRHHDRGRLAAAPRSTHHVRKFLDLLWRCADRPAGRVAVLQDQLVDTLRVLHRELDRGQGTIAFTQHTQPPDTDRVEHGEDIVDPVVEIALPRLGHRIRHPRTAMVEHDYPQTRAQGTIPAQMAGVFTNRFDRSPVLREKQDIGRALTTPDVGDPVPPDTHEPRLRPTHQPDRTTTPRPGARDEDRP